MTTPSEDKLAELRKELDTLDGDMVALLNQRAELALQVKAAKNQGNIHTYVPGREQEIFDRARDLASKGKFPPEAAERIFRTIISASRSLIGELSVAFAGAEGSVGHEAALTQFGVSAQYISSTSIDDVFQKVQSGTVKYGVVPFETATNGIVTPTFKSLYTNDAVKIIAEVPLKRSLALYSTAIDLAEIRRIFGEFSSLQQSSAWLRDNLPRAEVHVAQSPQDALAKASSDPTTAVIASTALTESTTLPVLSKGLETQELSSERYVVIGTEQPKATSKDKTSLFCVVKDEVGTLGELLGKFSAKGITLTKIESKPHPLNSFDVVFAIDFIGHADSTEVTEVIEEVRGYCDSMRVLGSYPAVVVR